MYEKLLEQIEGFVNNKLHYDDRLPLNEVLDLIIKIKTIKYMDLQTEILEASRKVSLN